MPPQPIRSHCFKQDPIGDIKDVIATLELGPPTSTPSLLVGAELLERFTVVVMAIMLHLLMAVREILVSQPSDLCGSLVSSLTKFVPQQSWSAQKRDACKPPAVLKRCKSLLTTAAQREHFESVVEAALTL